MSKEPIITEVKLGRRKAVGVSYKSLFTHIRDRIEIEKRLRGKRKMKVLIHESLHLIFPEKSETEILRAEKMLGNILWSQGYRFTDNKEK